MRPGPNGQGLSRVAIMTEIDNSLRRLGVNHVDLYQIHRNDPTTPIEETMEALHDVVKAGKARYIGASNMAAWQFARALYVADRHGWTRFATMQAQPALSRRGARDAPALQGGGNRRHPMEPDGARTADAELGRNQ
jgi:aryl-alcohol dehydrogenase-like predicted oxidoreductase